MSQKFPPIYIINLAKDKARREKIKQQCEEQNLSYTFVDAVYGKLLPKEIIEETTTPLCAEVCTLPMVGCGLSHIKAWRQIYRDGHDMAIILEDDAHLLKNMKEKFAKYIKQIPDDWELVYLGCQGACTMEPYTTIEWLNLASAKLIMSSQPYQKINDNVFIPEFPIGAHAYMINRKFCKKMMDIKLNTHIDLQMARADIKKYGVSPKLVCTNTQDSTIATREYPYMTLTFLSRVKQRGIDLAWMITEPQMQLFGQEINVISYLCLIVALLLRLYTKNAWKYLGLVHIPELLYGIVMKRSFRGLKNCLIFHAIGLLLGTLLSKTKQ